MPKRRLASIDREIGARILRARTAAGLSMSQLGKQIGVAHNAIFKYEHGEVPVTVSRLLMIGRATGYTLEHFITGLL